MKRHLIVIVCLLTWFCSTHAADGAELRTWTSKSGKFTVKAEFLSFSEGVVNLQRADGCDNSTSAWPGLSATLVFPPLGQAATDSSNPTWRSRTATSPVTPPTGFTEARSR